MPRIAVFKYFVFYFVSYDLSERYHVHVASTKSGRTGTAKFWLNPVELFEMGKLTEKEVNTVEKLLIKNEAKLIEQITNFAKGKKIKTLVLK
jgi:hypothetical protein